ncbi:M48 family metallopeptidase [Archangium sp.]|uniref:M48 family metallopeptidase n=1 Tax=Archangium sp. TaxID=1872627 RepID=UPI002ED9437B
MPHETPSIFQSAIDRRMRDALLADRHVQRSGSIARRRRLLTDALRLTRSVAPTVMDVLAACQETLGHAGPVELFVQPDQRIHAAAVEAPGEPPAIVLSSRLIEALTEAELRFVIGHQLGHLVLDHFALPVGVEGAEGKHLPRANVLALDAWNRAAEVSADRAGLLCAKDTEAALSASFKRTSGLASASVKSELAAYVRQVDALLSSSAAREKPREDEDMLGCFITHPFSPLRLRALVAFSRSRTFLRVAGHYGSDEGLPEEEADAFIARDFQELEPSGLAEKLPPGDMLAGLREELSLSERARLVRHLTVVAAAEGPVSDARFLELRRVAEALALPLWTIDEALRGATCPLD